MASQYSALRDYLPPDLVWPDAAWRTSARHPVVGEALSALLAHGEERGGEFALAERVDGEEQHLLDTPARANCAALATLSRMAADPALAATLTPLAAKLARSVTRSRARRDHWDNTQGNVFCVAALIDHARTFESAVPRMQLRAFVDGEPMGEARFESHRDPAVTLTRTLAAADAGQRRVLRIEHAGTGRAYYTARLRYAPAAGSEPVEAGMSLRREYSWQGYASGHWSFYHRELRHDAARFYSDYLPAGGYHLSYTAQVIAEGNFAIAPAHAEQMYAPDVFATAAPARVPVNPGSAP